ncbi:hypothetical protein LCGC14_1436190 [marine sediment metagenome]|uniref:Major tropism determinant N-terminal domain-containing protein n=1 Tax=marine sediment metagenome TaxID=412755 RepID=A0A0F9JM55_9ZZZZ
MSVKIGRQLEWAQNSIEVVRAKNTRGSALAVGDTVVLDTTNSSATEVAVTVTSTADDKAVFGMALEAIADGGYGLIQTKGPTALLTADASAAISVGDYLSAYSTATYAQKATSGKGGVFAIALEALGSSTGTIDAYIIGGAGRYDTAATSATFSSPTFDGAITIDGAVTVSSTRIITMAGSASATDALILTLGDILISDGHLDIVEADGVTDVLTLTHTGGIMASDEATLKITDGGDIASGGNMLRLVPTGTPDAASILLEIVGAGKIGQAIYVDGDPTGIDVVHLHGGGAMTNGFAVLGVTNDGNLATGGALVNLTLGGTPDTAARVFEIDGGSKDAIAMYIDSDAATNHAVHLIGAGDLANDKAMLCVETTATNLTAGSSLVRILDSGSAAGAGATVYGLLINMDGTNLEGLHVEAGTSLFVEAVTMGTTAKFYFRDTGLYLYSSTNGQLDIVADTTLAFSGASTFDSTVTAAGIVSVDATTASTSVTTGSIHTDGGLGVAKDLFLGGNLSIATAKKITTTAELTLNSVNPLTIQFGGVDWLQMDEAAISSFAAAGDTAGHAAYIETEDGGTDGGTASTGQAGGLYSFKTGDGSAAVTTDAVGGAGGALGLTGGAGAAADGTGTSGAGGTLTLTGGAGATSSGGTGTGGAGGDILLSPGALGAANGGTAGRSGRVVVADGRHLFVGVAATPGTTEGQNWIGLEDGGTDPTGTLANSLALYTPDAGDSLDFLHADGSTDSLGT